MGPAAWKTGRALLSEGPAWARRMKAMLGPAVYIALVPPTQGRDEAHPNKGRPMSGLLGPTWARRIKAQLEPND